MDKNPTENIIRLKTWDLVAVALYFLLVIGVGFYSLFRANRGTISGYFLAGRLMTWLPVGASLFASNIGSEHFIGLAGSGASAGIAVGAFEINACILIQLLGWVFLPVFIACGVCTLPEYMNRRFGGRRIRAYLACLSMVLYIFTKISVNLYAGSLFIQQSLQWNLYPSILFILALTCLCTVTGGLAAVIYTDTLQTVIMLIGSIMLTVFAFERVGGYHGLRDKYSSAIPTTSFEFIYALVNNQTSALHYITRNSPTLNVTTLGNSFTPLVPPQPNTLRQMYLPNISTLRVSLDKWATEGYGSKTNTHDNFVRERSVAAVFALCGLPNTNAWRMLRNPLDPDMPWPGFILGQTAASIWYWCADQMMVQRALAAKDLSHAQGGTLFAGYLKMLPLFLIIMPGMISRVLFPDKIACATPDSCRQVCGNPTGCSNLAYPTLVLEILPVGARGIMLAVMLAALMSDLTSIFNSASTLFTIDIWKLIRPKATVRELLITGRIFILFMTVIGIMWIPVIQAMQGGQLYIYIQSVAAYLSPPIACVYLLAVLWPRCNEKGAFWSLMVGMVIGVIRMIMDFLYKEPYCGEIDKRPLLLAKLHYMYFAFMLFWSTAIVCFVVSYLTNPSPHRYLDRTTYWTRFDGAPRTSSDNENVPSKAFKAKIPPIPSLQDFMNGSARKYEVEEAVPSSKPQNIDEDPDVESSVPKSTTGVENDGKGLKNGGGQVNANGTYTSAGKMNRALDLPDAEKGSDMEIMQFQDDSKPKKYPKSLLKRMWDWFLGYTESEAEAEISAEQYEEHLIQITSLYQGKKSKIFLNINLVTIIAIALFMFVYFTIH